MAPVNHNESEPTNGVFGPTQPERIMNLKAGSQSWETKWIPNKRLNKMRRNNFLLHFEVISVGSGGGGHMAGGRQSQWRELDCVCPFL